VCPLYAPVGEGEHIEYWIRHPNSRVYQRRPTSRFDAIHHHRTHLSLRSLSTLDLADCLMARDVGIENAFLPSIWGPAIHFQNKSSPTRSNLERSRPYPGRTTDSAEAAHPKRHDRRRITGSRILDRRRILRWQVPNPPRVPHSLGSHHLLLYKGPEQFTSSFLQGWRVGVIGRNRSVSLSSHFFRVVN
jgi:hypothetical protein